MATQPLWIDARQTVSALAQLIETALAVEGDAWVAAIDATRTHRPIDNACDALAALLGESPERWQAGLGYYPTGGARGLLRRAYAWARIETDDPPPAGRAMCDAPACENLAQPGKRYCTVHPRGQG